MKIELTLATIRDFRATDAESIARHLNDEQVWRNLRDRVPFPYSVDDAREFIERVDREEPQTKFGIAVDGEVVGACGFELGRDVHHRTAEIGFWLGRAHWGRGIMSEVVPAMTDWALATLDVCRLEAQVFGWNEASGRVLEKAGYVREARLRDAVTKRELTADLLIYARFPKPRH